jgi:hypothetical protein
VVVVRSVACKAIGARIGVLFIGIGLKGHMLKYDVDMFIHKRGIEVFHIPCIQTIDFWL